MTREDALEILNKFLKDQRLITHCLATEATMRGLARYFGEDQEKWSIVGLLHDADYELSKNHPEKHGLLLFKKGKKIPEIKQSIPDDIKYAIESHNFEYTHIMPKNKMDWSIYCCDELTIIIAKLTLESSSKKLEDLTNDFILSKLKELNFATNSNKDKIYMCEDKLGIPLIELITIALNSMKEIHENLGL